MNIIINKKYYITTDSKQFILHKIIKDDDEILTYYSTLGSVVTALIRDQIKNDNIKTLKQLDNKIEKYGQECQKAFLNK